MIRVLLAEDQAMVRGALSALLSREPDIEVVAEVARGDEVVQVALSTQPDIALLDIEMPGGDVHKIRVYSFAIGSFDDKTIRLVSLQVQRINPQGNPSKPDLVVSVEGLSGIALYNTGDGFKTGDGQ